MHSLLHSFPLKVPSSNTGTQKKSTILFKNQNGKKILIQIFIFVGQELGSF